MRGSPASERDPVAAETPAARATSPRGARRGGEVAGGGGRGADPEPRQIADRLFDDRLVGAQVIADPVELAQLGEEDGASQLDHTEVEPQERALADLDIQPGGGPRTPGRNPR